MSASGGRASPLDRLNRAEPEDAENELLACCGSRSWAKAVAAARPFAGAAELAAAAERAFRGLSRTDWLEAFAAHPRIGERKAARATGERAADWSRGEQAGTAGASAALRERLARGNRAYEERFGWIYLVAAAGKSAGELVALLERRLANDPETELSNAAREQRKITRQRLDKLLFG